LPLQQLPGGACDNPHGFAIIRVEQTRNLTHGDPPIAYQSIRISADGNSRPFLRPILDGRFTPESGHLAGEQGFRCSPCATSQFALTLRFKALATPNRCGPAGRRDVPSTLGFQKTE
jgi:hypothetical protein